MKDEVRGGTDTATPSSRRRIDGVEVDATIQDERAVNFDFHTGAQQGEEHAIELGRGVSWQPL